MSTVAIGGERLGSGKKQDLHLKNYYRSTHDIGYVWRSSMAPGTLVPFMSEPALPGDSFEINLNCEVLTLPTVGPLFGSFKVQLDVFMCPIRLYNARLHMNELGIGMKMSDIKLPLVKIPGKWFGDYTKYLDDNYFVGSSSLFKYLGVSGLGRPRSDIAEGDTFVRYFSAVPFLAYWDIYKQYYANKMEEHGKMLHWTGSAAYIQIESATIQGLGFFFNFLGLGNAKDYAFSPLTILYLNFFDGTDEPDPSSIKYSGGGAQDLPLTDLFDDITWERTTNRLRCAEPTSNLTITDFFIQDEPVAPNNPDDKQNIQIKDFDLEHIDLMRKRLLRWKQEDVAPIIGWDNPGDESLALYPYSAHRFTVPASLGTKFAVAFPQESLALKTYQSDLFNNWITTEWIDGPEGISAITAVDTSGDSFTIDSLNLAQKVYHMLNRIAVSGGTYDDWLDAVYTHERKRGVENPVYMGSLIKELSFQEVVGNVDQDLPEKFGGFQPQGKLSGRGRLTGKNKGGYVKVKVDEPCYIMGIVSITPRIDYSQGNAWHMNLKTLDDFHKPALDGIGYQDLITDQMAWQDTECGPNGELTFNSLGKQPAWINYMTNVNKVYGNFADRKKEMYMTLCRRYNYSATGITDLTSYIDPSLFNFIFAKTDLGSQNFWVQISNNITARRKMSAKVIPNL